VRRTSGRTSEDLYTLLGAAAASVATTWIFYSKVLPFEGAIGFVSRGTSSSSASTAG
jgi:phosphate transport system permease protein